MKARNTNSTQASVFRHPGKSNLLVPFVSLALLAVLLIPSGPISAAHCNGCLGNVVLWSRDGEAKIIRYDAHGTYVSRKNYSHSPGWTATSYYAGSTATSYPDSERLLWTHTNGTAALWSLNAQGNSVRQKSYGPFTGWTATSYLRTYIYNVASGSYRWEGRLLWTHTDGTAGLWKLDANDDFVDGRHYGPFTGWAATSYERTYERTYLGWGLLWTHTDGTAGLWKLDANGDFVSGKNYGPYPGWAATSYNVYPSIPNNVSGELEEGPTQLLWTRTDNVESGVYAPHNGRASLWTLDANDDYVSHTTYSERLLSIAVAGAIWKAQSFSPWYYCDGQCPPPSF